jgi:hypothetical protein
LCSVSWKAEKQQTLDRKPRSTGSQLIIGGSQSTVNEKPAKNRSANPLAANKPPSAGRKIHRRRRKTASGLLKNFRQISNGQGDTESLFQHSAETDSRFMEV